MMKLTTWMHGVLFVGIAGLAMMVSGCGEGGEGPIVAPPDPPAEYADKHMPAGWWTDPKIIEEGKKIFIGETNIDVNCASCHGKDGKPVKAGARDFRNTERMKLYSDSVWLWRISEGVPNTKMKAWKSKLTDENDRWKVMAYERTFGLKGLGYDVARKEWVPVADLGKAAPAGGDGTPRRAGAPGGSGSRRKPRRRHRPRARR